MMELDTLLTMIEVYVLHCFLVETPPRVSELAELAGVSACTLGRQARRHYINLAQVLKDEQLARAKRMLRFTEDSITRIGYACGFGTRRTFFRAFQRTVGMTPAQYRRVTKGSPNRQELSAGAL